MRVSESSTITTSLPLSTRRCARLSTISVTSTCRCAGWSKLDDTTSPTPHEMASLTSSGTLVDEQDEQRRVRMIDRDAFGDRVQQRRLAGARRRDDQRALAVADRRDQIDRAARELGAALRRTSRLHEQLPLRIRRGQRIEVRTPRRELPDRRR